METTVYTVGTRKLSFLGYSLKGQGDLTSISKATGEAFWPCSLLLADYLAKDYFKGNNDSHVLELGCGLGLCGTLASVVMGRGSTVTMTDGDEGCLNRCRASHSVNYRPEVDAETSFQKLQWGDMESMAGLPQYDLILASEILYDEVTASAMCAFAQTVNQLLGQAGQCIVAFQQRQVSVTVLTDAMGKVGFLHGPVPGEYYEDLYDERHEEPTLLTNRYLILFQRKLEADKDP